jgi:hypothetical protein
VNRPRPLPFDEGQVAHGPEADFLPNAQEGIDVRPTVEGDATAIGLDHLPDFREGRAEPIGILVTDDHFVIVVPSALVADQIGRVGENEIDRFRTERGQDIRQSPW